MTTIKSSLIIFGELGARWSLMTWAWKMIGWEMFGAPWRAVRRGLERGADETIAYRKKEKFVEAEVRAGGASKWKRQAADSSQFHYPHRHRPSTVPSDNKKWKVKKKKVSLYLVVYLPSTIFVFIFTSVVGPAFLHPTSSASVNI